MFIGVIIDTAVGYMSKTASRFLAAVEFVDYISRTDLAHSIRQTIKHHKGAFLQEPVNKGARVGLQFFGPWNGTTKQACLGSPFFERRIV